MHHRVPQILLLLLALGGPAMTFSRAAGKAPAEPTLDVQAISRAAGSQATAAEGGVVRLGWARTDVPVVVDGFPLDPMAGLGSWAGFSPLGGGRAMLMGDTVVFEDEVDAAIDAAFAGGLEVTALHNHFFYDRPRVYFLHLGGEGDAVALAGGVGQVWGAIRGVRAKRPQPSEGFGPPIPTDTKGKLSADRLAEILGHPAAQGKGVVKITISRTGSMHGHQVAGPMGLTTWAAFSGSDESAVVDGDLIMTAEEVQRVLRALRGAGIHVVALHHHMTGGEPFFYFVHYWGRGTAEGLASAVRTALDAQLAVAER